MNLAIVLYGLAQPHHISKFIWCHEDTSANHLTRVSIKKQILPNAAAMLKGRLILRLAGNVGIFDHLGKPNNIFKRLFGHLKPKKVRKCCDFLNFFREIKDQILTIWRFC